MNSKPTTLCACIYNSYTCFARKYIPSRAHAALLAVVWPPIFVIVIHSLATYVATFACIYCTNNKVPTIIKYMQVAVFIGDGVCMHILNKPLNQPRYTHTHTIVIPGLHWVLPTSKLLFWRYWIFVWGKLLAQLFLTRRFGARQELCEKQYTNNILTISKYMQVTVLTGAGICMYILHETLNQLQ